MKTVWARLNQPAILPCDLPMNASEIPNFLLEWRRNGTLVFNSFGGEQGFASPEYQGRISRAQGLNLTIHSVQPDDQSQYQCFVTRFAQEKAAIGDKQHGIMVRLVVHSLPRIVKPLDREEIFVRDNGTARVECLADGIPTPNVRWQRLLRSGDLLLMEEGPSLIVEHFTREKEGEYICEAENFEGRADVHVELRKKKPLRIDRQNPSLVDKTAQEGASVFWHCAAEDSAKTAADHITIRWSKNGRPISELEVGLRAHLKEGEFGILRIRRNDTGDYACEATSFDSSVDDSVLERDSVMVHLNVQYKPEINVLKTRRFLTLLSGNAAELECFVDANPVPSLIRWTRNGRVILAHEEHINDEKLLLSRVHIQSATPEADAGIYTCEAENSVGASTPFEIHVVVADAPKFTKMPASLYRVREGDSLEVHCEGFAEVPLRRMWTKDGQILDVSGPKFVLQSAHHEDHGLYRCTLVNSITTVFKQFQVQVENTAPQCPSHTRVECLGQQGLLLSWQPGFASGNFTQLFRVFYRQMPTENEADWLVTEFTNHAKWRLENLGAFAGYDLMVEASNKFGQTNCSLSGTHYTCSKLRIPNNFRIDFLDGKAQRQPILLWDEVKEAAKYRVKYRYRHRHQQSALNFKDLAELNATEFALPLRRLNLAGNEDTNGDAVEFIVQAIRPRFISSDPTEAIAFPQMHSSKSTALTFSLLLAGSLLLAILFIALLVIFFKRIGRLRNRNIFSEKQTIQEMMHSKLGTPSDVSAAAQEKQQKYGQQQQYHVDNSVFNSSHCISSSTLTSAPYKFRQSVAITRKLFPDNYIPSKLAEFDEDIVEDYEEPNCEGESFEQYGQFSSCENTFLGQCNGSSASANFIEIQSEPSMWPAGKLEDDHLLDGKSNSYMEMMPVSADMSAFYDPTGGCDAQSAVDEMLRDKYIFAGTKKLDQIEESRIEQLRRELLEKYA